MLTLRMKKSSGDAKKMQRPSSLMARKNTFQPFLCQQVQMDII
jgi:hypothetical protein